MKHLGSQSSLGSLALLVQAQLFLAGHALCESLELISLISSTLRKRTGIFIGFSITSFFYFFFKDEDCLNRTELGFSNALQTSPAQITRGFWSHCGIRTRSTIVGDAPRTPNSWRRRAPGPVYTASTSVQAPSHSFPEWLPLMENMTFWGGHQAKLGISPSRSKSPSQVKRCYLHILFSEGIQAGAHILLQHELNV